MRKIDFNQCQHRTIEKLRYRDTDQQGHVNNAVYSTFFESGRTDLIYGPKPLRDPDGGFVIAHISVDYIEEIKWPGQVEIKTGVLKIGKSSVTMVQGVFFQDRLKAYSESVIVHVDKKTKKSRLLNPQARETFEKYRIEGTNEA
jgi:acyl-CoA thioester hydrolase